MAGLLLWLLAAPLWAEDFTATVSAGSDYIFRSETQTNHRPVLQLSLEYDDPSGFYTGLFASQVSWVQDARPPGSTLHNALELDIWSGFRHSLGHDVSYDLGLYHYAYPGHYPAHGYAMPDTTEAYAQWGWRGLSLRYWYALGNWFGMAGSAGSGYAELNETYGFAGHWQLLAHLGREWVAGYHGAASFSDWKLGLGYTFAHGWLATLACSRGNGARRYYSNNQGVLLTRGVVVASLSKTFSF